MGDPYPGKIKYAGTPVQLTYEEIVASVALGGWPASLWPKAVAVIAAESNRYTNIYNTYLQGHYGLMQIGKQQHPGDFTTKSAWVIPYVNCNYGYQIYKSQGWGAWESATNGRYTGYLLQAKAAVSAVASKRKTRFSMTDTAFYQSLYVDPQRWKADLSTAAAQALADSAAGKIATGAGAAGSAIGGTEQAAGAGITDAIASIQSNSVFGVFQLLLGGAKWLSDSSNWLRIVQVIAGGGLLLAGLSIVSRPVTSPVLSVAKKLPV